MVDFFGETPRSGPARRAERHPGRHGARAQAACTRPHRAAGGSATISNGVLNGLKAYAGTVVRQSGTDRYATAVAISVANHRAGTAEVVYITTGTTFPDALAAAPIAGRQRGPVLLVPPTSLPSSVASELRRLSPNRVVIVGGTNSVSDRVAQAILAAIRR